MPESVSFRDEIVTCFPDYGNSAVKSVIVSRSEPVALVGGGDVSDRDIEDAKRHAHTFVAADGGANQLVSRGITPSAIIGDFDSIDAATRATLPPSSLHRIAEQDSTDFDKCLRNIQAPLIVAIGFLGARVDHQLGAFNRLAARPDHRCVLLGARDVVFHTPPRLTLDLPAGTRVSLFPMAPVSGRSTGLRWPIDGLEFSPAGRSGTSNEADGTQVRLEMDAPGMLIILPRDQLDTALRAVQSAARGTWSALSAR